MIIIRESNINDTELLFKWVNDPVSRNYAITGKIIKWEDHIEWFYTKLESASYVLIAETEDRSPIGQIRFDLLDDFYLIDFYVAKEYRGKGYGKLLLRKGMDYIVNKKKKVVFKAIVNTSNVPSINSFLSEGFTFSSHETVNQQSFFVYFKEYTL